VGLRKSSCGGRVAVVGGGKELNGDGDRWIEGRCEVISICLHNTAGGLTSAF
jgi:tRNA(Phe) wybutosine-synthesizing methylase Tyw3